MSKYEIGMKFQWKYPGMPLSGYVLTLVKIGKVNRYLTGEVNVTTTEKSLDKNYERVI